MTKIPSVQAKQRHCKHEKWKSHQVRLMSLHFYTVLLLLKQSLVVENLSFLRKIPFLNVGKFGHTIQQYSTWGKLLQVIGTPGKAGSGLNPLQFDQPAEIFVEENGDLYVVDGDGGMNNRLLKLTPGKLSNETAIRNEDNCVLSFNCNLLF